MTNIFQIKPIIKLTSLFCGIYLLSYLGYLFPILNAMLFWIILITTAILSFKKLEYGVLIVLSELFIGGRGYLFSFNFFGFVVSIRLVLFILVFLIWLFFYHNYDKYKFAKSKFFIPYIFLTVIIIFALSRGIYFGHSIKNIFFDFNGYLYFAFIFPVFDVLNKNFVQRLLKNLIAGGFALAIFTLIISSTFPILHPEVQPDKSGILSFEFEKKENEAQEISHTIFAKEELKSIALKRNIPKEQQAEYRWTRDTGVGELAYISGKFFRFSSSSQIYLLSLLAFLLFSFKDQFVFGIKNISKKELIFKIIILIILLLALLIGFSRSIWLGAGILFLFFLFSLPKKYSLKIILIFLGIVGIFMILSSTLAPKIYEILLDRVYTIFHPQIQSTSLTRINILESAFDEIKKHTFFGSGFGKIITYESVIPGASGILKVFSFEWQYLEMILKLGLVGAIIYLWFLYLIFKEKFNLKNLTNDDKWVVSALIIGLIGILVTNITMPYLNHPLGIGYLIIVMAMIYQISIKNTESRI